MSVDEPVYARGASRTGFEAGIARAMPHPVNTPPYRIPQEAQWESTYWCLKHKSPEARRPRGGLGSVVGIVEEANATAEDLLGKLHSPLRLRALIR
jgi:hypothetical protein